MQTMFVEIKQHQSARKQPAQNRAPAIGGGEKPVLVEQQKFVRFGPEHGDAGFAEDAGAIDQAMLRRHPLALALGGGEDRERPADHGPAFITRYMRQRMTMRWLQRDGGENRTLH